MRTATGQAQPGQIMPLMALMLVALMGIAALAIDGSTLYAQHRTMQADLVKVATAQLYNVAPSTTDYTTTVEAAMTTAATLLARDGYPATLTFQPIGGAFTNGLCGSDATAGLTLCTPPQTGPFAGAPHFAYLSGRWSRVVGGFFGGVMGLGWMRLSVRAVAWHGGFHQPYAIIGLDPTAPDCAVAVQNTASSLTVNGSIMANAQSCVKGGTALVYGHSDAVQATTASNGTQISGNGGTNTGVPAVVDPYPPVALTTPSTPATVVCATTDTSCATHDFGSVYGSASPCAATIETLLGVTSPQAGSYYYFPPAGGSPALVSGFKTKGAAYYFLPSCDESTGALTYGTYDFSGSPADMDIANTPTINSFDAVFVLDSAANTLIKQTGQARWVLNAPTSGPFQGIALYQTQPCTPSAALTLTGNSNSLINGVIDTPCATITVSGDATDNPFVNGVVVGYTVAVAGNGSAVVTYDPSGTPADKGSVLVE